MYVHTIRDTLTNCIFDHDVKPLPKCARPLDDPAPIEIPPSEAPRITATAQKRIAFTAEARAKSNATKRRRAQSFADVALAVVRAHPGIEVTEVTRTIITERRMSTSHGRVKMVLKALTERGALRRARMPGRISERARPYVYEVAS